MPSRRCVVECSEYRALEVCSSCEHHTLGTTAAPSAINLETLSTQPFSIILDALAQAQCSTLEASVQQLQEQVAESKASSEAELEKSHKAADALRADMQQSKDEADKAFGALQTEADSLKATIQSLRKEVRATTLIT